jgi:hypothetical protein
MGFMKVSSDMIVLKCALRMTSAILARSRVAACSIACWKNPIQILDSSSYAGQIGQWQNGYPEVIDKDKRTTDKIWYPKPTWAEAPALSTSSTT